MAKRENSNLELRVAEESMAPRLDRGELLRFPEWLLIVAKRKSFILKFVAGAAVLSLVISLLLPKEYTAKTRIMPPQQNQSLTMTAMMSQLGPLAALAGQGLGLKTPSDIYVAMLKSDTIANALIDRFSLMQLYHSRFREDARKKLAGNTVVSSGKEGIISVEVDDRDPHRAADIANGYIEELEKVSRTLAVSEAAQRRVFFERETRQAMDDLSNAEVALKQTQEKTGLIMLDAQSRAIIETLSSLRARVAAKEVEIHAMESFAAAGNPDLERARQELAALRAQQTKLESGSGKQGVANIPIENVPTSGLEYIRHFREVKYREALFELLAKQFEAAKIDEARDTFLVQQLDKASVPERKSWPPRTLIIIGATLLSFFIAVLVAFYLEKLEGAKEDPHFSSQLQLFTFYLSRRSKR